MLLLGIATSLAGNIPMFGQPAPAGASAGRAGVVVLFVAGPAPAPVPRLEPASLPPAPRPRELPPGSVVWRERTTVARPGAFVPIAELPPAFQPVRDAPVALPP